MATKLRRLVLNRVDLVDRGANPEAHITMFKRDEQPAPVGMTRLAKRAVGTTALMRTADTIQKFLPDLTGAQSVDLAARLRPDLYGIHAGHPAVRKAGPPSEKELEDRLAAEYVSVRDALRRAADTKAAVAIGQTMAPLIAALLNQWSAAE
jgi:hypothetical protein